MDDQTPASRADPEATELRERVAELEDRWRRAEADLENLRKRIARDEVATQERERARVAADWLPVLDNLERALAHAEADPGSIVDGVRAVREQALGVLAMLGYPRQADEGQPFDPARHEAIGTVADPEVPAGTVLRVVRPGYGDDTHPLRPAAVVVSTGDSA